MIRTSLQRLFQVVAVLIVVTFCTTALANLVPGSPAYLVLGPYASASQVALFNKQYGFNLPLFDRYWHWVLQAFQGNIGTSIQAQEPVVRLIRQALPITLELAILALTTSLLLAITFAMISVVKPEGLIDRVLTAISSTFTSLPAFISAVFLVFIFTVKAHLLPSEGWVPLNINIAENLKHVVLPLVTLVITITPLMMRILRSDLIAVLSEDYISSARARGLPEWYVLTRHAFRPAATSLLTISGLVFGYLFGGSIIVETFYSLPGIGYLVSGAETSKDIPVVQGVVVVVSCAYIVINIVVDLCAPLIDPRLRARQ